MPQGTLLVGVMDEFGVLQEGEVFVQVCTLRHWRLGGGLDLQVSREPRRV